MNRNIVLTAAVVPALWLAAAMPARACDGLDYGYGYGWLYNTLRYEVPHFAAFPPVYYSQPVPRTYGYSPFAYPPHVMTPEVVGDARPAEIINPHVPNGEAKEASAPRDRTAASSREPQPVVVPNPFVASADSFARNE